MTQYQNFSGESGVRFYQIEEDRIIVRFSDGATYEYSNSSAGSGNIAEMKVLALRGRGLNSFINRYVKKRYSRKLKAGFAW